MSYTMTGGLGVVLKPGYTPPADTAVCYAECERDCMQETGGLYVPFVTTYCTADCYDNSGCENLPYPDTGDEYELPDLPGTVLPTKPSSSDPASTKPTTSGGGTKPSSSNGGKKPSSSSTTKTTSDDDDEPSPVAPSGAKIGVVLLGLSAAIFGGVWWMRRRKR